MLLVSHPFLYFYAGGQSFFIIQYYGILRVWFPGTTQIISKKRCGWCLKAIK